VDTPHEYPACSRETKYEQITTVDYGGEDSGIFNNETYNMYNRRENNTNVRGFLYK
jgi:hypothetical protein